MPHLGSVWWLSICSVSTSVWGLGISPPSPWACLSKFIFGSYELWSLFCIWESLFHLSGPVAPVWCILPEAFCALHTLCSSLHPPSRPRAQFNRGQRFLHRSVSTVEPSSRSFLLAVPWLLGFDFGALCAVSPARFGASPFSFVFCLCLACTANWKPFVLFFSEIHFREIYPSTCRATLTALWSPMLPTWQ